MQLEATRKRFSVDEYYRMAEVGILGPEDRVELIDGEILQMSPIGPPHSGCLNRMLGVFHDVLRGRTVVSAQNPVRLSDYTEPQPDLALLRPRKDFYSSKTPAPADVLLLVELAGTSLRYDREVKLPRYAEAGIPEVWIVDLEARTIETHRKPSAEGYEKSAVLERDDPITVGAFPESVFKVRDLLG